MNIVRGVYMW